MANDSAGGGKKSIWLSHPQLPIEYYPIFVWPPRPVAALKFLLSRDFMWSLTLPFGIFAALLWFYLTPTPERVAEFEAGWIIELFVRNLVILTIIAGGLHLYFFTFRLQGDERRFDAKEYPTKGKQFTTGNQFWDNVIWSCASGVTFWTAYEAGFLWAYANNLLPLTDWNTNPIWFFTVFVLIIFWQSFHFYWIHRLIHWHPLYKAVHSLHHRNVNTGPWSGLSMHPVEHLIYFSSLLIHVVVPSHPIHVVFHLILGTIGAVIFHTGYEGFTVKGRLVYLLGIFHHQLHHRYYNCNYGTEAIPLDRWFGRDHDGTEESTRQLMASLRQKSKQATRRKETA